MGDRWMDERDRDWRERDWRRSEAYGRGGGDRHRSGESRRWDEDRTWTGAGYEDEDPFNDPSQARDKGDEEGYGGGLTVASGGAVYSAPRRYADERGGRSGAQRFSSQDYTGGRGGYGESQGRSYGGQAYGQSYGGRSERLGASDPGRARLFGPDPARRYEDDSRSYGAQGRQRDDWRDEDRRRGEYGGGYRASYGRDNRQDRDDERRGEGAGDFLQRTGERISSWFRGDHLMRGSRDEDEGGARRYREDFGREARPVDRGHRGVGPKGYKRSDDRISDEVHDRLTDDPWLDASNIDVEVKSGEVTLSGFVDNREAKHRAERLIEDLSGVGHVQNNLRVNPQSATGAGRGFGSSALEAEMRRNELAQDPGNQGASGLSGRTSTGAQAERSAGTATEGSVDPKTGAKRS